MSITTLNLLIAEQLPPAAREKTDPSSSISNRVVSIANDRLSQAAQHKRQGESKEERAAKRAAYKKKYREEHKEKIAIQDKQYRETHKDKIAAYYQAHKEEIAANKKRRYEAHKDELSILLHHNRKAASGRRPMSITNLNPNEAEQSLPMLQERTSSSSSMSSRVANVANDKLSQAGQHIQQEKSEEQKAAKASQNKAYYEANGERIREKSRMDYRLNKKKKAEQRRLYWLENKEWILAERKRKREEKEAKLETNSQPASNQVQENGIGSQLENSSLNGQLVPYGKGESPPFTDEFYNEEGASELDASGPFNADWFEFNPIFFDNYKC